MGSKGGRIPDLSTRFLAKQAGTPALGCFYFEDEPGRRAAAHLLTRDETQRIAANIAKVPGCWSGPELWVRSLAVHLHPDNAATE
jgi:hypothetical protein